jgi:predicted small metal-binding protein
MVYESGQALTEHMRSTHNLGGFAVALSCCGSNFKEAKELSAHAKAAHRIDLTVQT